MAREVCRHQAAEVLLGGSIRRPVVVGEIEVSDARVERAEADVALHREGTVMAEVVPQAERDQREAQPAATTAAVLHRVVAVCCCDVAHGASVCKVVTRG